MDTAYQNMQFYTTGTAPLKLLHISQNGTKQPQIQTFKVCVYVRCVFLFFPPSSPYVFPPSVFGAVGERTSSHITATHCHAATFESSNRHLTPDGRADVSLANRLEQNSAAQISSVFLI